MVSDVIYKEKCVGAKVGCSPEAAVFLLAGRVREGEKVGFPIDGAGDRIGVL